MDEESDSPLPRILPQPPLGLGLLACAPLFAAYELGLALSGLLILGCNGLGGVEGEMAGVLLS